jgi:hypothetical protein
VDRAQKELNIEKQIKKIEDTWAVLALAFNPIPDSDITALVVSMGVAGVAGQLGLAAAGRPGLGRARWTTKP